MKKHHLFEKWAQDFLRNDDAAASIPNYASLNRTNMEHELVVETFLIAAATLLRNLFLSVECTTWITKLIILSQRSQSYRG